MSKYLYIFIDEGGNFDFSPRGTKYFTLTTVTKFRPFLLDKALTDIKYDLIEKGMNIECFHASEDKQMVRNIVFDAIRNNLNNLQIDCLVVEKDKVPLHMREVKDFYPYMLGYILKRVFHTSIEKDPSEIIVITDSIPVKKKRHIIEKSIKQTLSGMLPEGVEYNLLHHSSKSCNILQVVDYCNWAIFKKWEYGDMRSYSQIRDAVGWECNIFEQGKKVLKK